MSSHNPHTTSDATLERLFAQVHAIMARYPDTQWLLSKIGDSVACAHDDIIETRQVPATPPPAPLVEALRAPVGAQRVVDLAVYGKPLRTAIAGVGHRDPALEQRVWREIQRTALEIGAA